MTIFDLSKVDEVDKAISAELCVVGAGVAGLLLASRLARSGKKVVVIESGKEHFDKDIHALNAVEDVSARYSRELTGRYRGLGGSSSRWGGRLIPLNRSDMAERDYLGLPAWPVDVERLERYGEEIERLFKVTNGSFYELPRTATYRPDILANNDALDSRWAKCPGFKMCNVSHVLSAELERPGNLEIWLDATVCQFELDRDRGQLKSVVARNFAGRTIAVQAKHFVIAAGAIETTRLMMLMDRYTEGRISSETDALGRYFQDHLKVEVGKIDRSDPVRTNRLFGYRYIDATRRDLHLDVRQDTQQSEAIASAFAYITMDLDRSPLAALKQFMQSLQQRHAGLGELLKLSRNLGVIARTAYWRYIRQQLFVPGGTDFCLMVCAEQLPDWKNRISLSTCLDRLGIPKARIEWQPMPGDERTIRLAMSQVLAYWKAGELQRMAPLRLSEAASDPITSILDKAEACAHPSGTTRMGTDRKRSVVDPNMHCHSVPNVSIVSASVFPSSGSANPTFTIMKLAFLFADNYIAGL